MSRAVVHAILRREGRSLMQYLREVPPWVSPTEQNAQARLHEAAQAEMNQLEAIGLMYQKHFHETAHMGGYPDFTPFNDMALHYLLPQVIREQQDLLAGLERDRAAVQEADIGAAIDELITMKRRHVSELESLHTVPHTFRTQNV
jgi:hypothetical protein